MKNLLIIAGIEMLFFIGGVAADDSSFQKVQSLATDAKLNATMEIVKGEKNKTLHIYSISDSGERKELMTTKGVQSFFTRNNSKYLFFRTYAGGGEWPGLHLYDGINGELFALGNFPACDVSNDGQTMFTYIPEEDAEIVGIGVLYNIPTMKEICRFDFSLYLKTRYSNISNIGHFSIGIAYNETMNGFELLFNHDEELGDLTCTGIITLDDRRFNFTERKKELLKIMGYKF
jgi:hypothetical protein